MKDSISKPVLVVAIMALTCLAGEPIAIPWYTIDGGGAMRSTSVDERFVLSGTIGQPDAGVMEGGDFKLTGGFWFETPPGDCNASGVADLEDHAHFADCMTLADMGSSPGCECHDVDRNGRIDLADFAQNQVVFGE